MEMENKDGRGGYSRFFFHWRLEGMEREREKEGGRKGRGIVTYSVFFPHSLRMPISLPCISARMRSYTTAPSLKSTGMIWVSTLNCSSGSTRCQENEHKSK